MDILKFSIQAKNDICSGQFGEIGAFGGFCRIPLIDELENCLHVVVLDIISETVLKFPELPEFLCRAGWFLSRFKTQDISDCSPEEIGIDACRFFHSKTGDDHLFWDQLGFCRFPKINDL